MKKGQEVSKFSQEMKVFHQNLPKKQLRKHKHPESHIFIPLKGDIIVETEHENFKVSPGKMLFLASNISHSFSSSDLQGERLIALLKHKIKDTVILPKSHLLQELLFHFLVTKCDNSLKQTTTLIKSVFNELCEGSNVNLEKSLTSIKDERLELAVGILKEELHISISEVASRAGTTTKTLNRVSIQELGYGPKKVQAAIRAEKAKELISSGKYNITETAFEVGYKELSNFIRAYRDYWGNVPSDDRV